MWDIQILEERTTFPKLKKNNVSIFFVFVAKFSHFLVKMLSKRLESIREQAWKLCHVDQNEALSEFDDCFDNDTSDDYEEHEEILF